MALLLFLFITRLQFVCRPHRTNVQRVVRLLRSLERPLVRLRAMPLQIGVHRVNLACLALALGNPRFHPLLQRGNNPRLFFGQVFQLQRIGNQVV